MKIYEVKDGGDGITLGSYLTIEAALACAAKEDYVEYIFELELNENTFEFTNTGITWERDWRKTGKEMVKHHDAPEN